MTLSPSPLSARRSQGLSVRELCFLFLGFVIGFGVAAIWIHHLVYLQ